MAITHKDLWNKAKVFIERALARRNESAFDEFQLWAAIALEILGKAVLAKIHPVLVVNPEKFESLLVACGYSNSSDYKTIMASTLFERCKIIVKGFDKVAHDFCIQMANMRNADLHSGEIPFEGIAMEKWQPKYWRVTQLLLNAQGLELKDYIGEPEAIAAIEIINDASIALRKAVEGRIRKHALMFEEIHPIAQRAQVKEHTQITINARLDHNEHDFACPACNCPGIMSGELVDQVGTGAEQAEPWVEEVENYFDSAAFECVVCGLKLLGADEIEAAGLKPHFTKLDYKDIEYEEDYGND